MQPYTLMPAQMGAFSFATSFKDLNWPMWDSDILVIIAIFGLTRNTSQADIIKATLDSLSYQTLDLIESMEKDAKISISEIRVDGGMINNNNFQYNVL